MKSRKSSQHINVSKQKHYTQHNIQVIQFCHENELNWCEANVVKYVCRHKAKNGLQDLMKAMDYLKCLINFERTGKFLTPDKL